MSILEHVVVPVASEEDARATAAALRPFLSQIDRVTALHVIEKGGGTIDKAPMEKRRDDAAEFLGIVESEVGATVDVTTQIEFRTSIVTAIFDVATAVDATAVAFRLRGGSRVRRLLTGETATNLVIEPELPVISLPTEAGS